MSRTRTLGTTAAVLLLGAATTDTRAAAAVVAAMAADRATAERVWYAQGLLHPAIVHVPIGLLVAAAIAACLRVVFRRISPGVVYYCLLIGALGMIPSCLAGWAWAPQKDPGYVDPFDSSSSIFWHRWGGVGVAVASLLVSVWATSRLLRKRRYDLRVAAAGAAVPVGTTPAGERVAVVEPAVPLPDRAPGQLGWQFATVLLAVATGWVAHDGGELVYPNNFQTVLAIARGDEPVKLKGDAAKKDKAVAEQAKIVVPPPPNAPALSAAAAAMATAATAPTTAAAATLPADPTTAANPVADAPPVAVASGDKVDFAKQVWPIWQDKCIYCHGAEKNKGKLRMHTEEDSKKGGPDDGPLYVAGKSGDSALIKRAHDDDPDVVMPPPKEKKKLTPDEIKVMAKWIDEGAVWNLPAK